MKKILLLVLVGGLLCTFALSFCGCSGCIPPFGGEGCAQLGETEEEGRRRHQRNAQLNHQEFMGDIDRALLYDKPSRATPRRIP